MILARHAGLAAGVAALLLGFALLRPWAAEQGPLALFLLAVVALQFAVGWLLARLLGQGLVVGLALVGALSLAFAHGWEVIASCVLFAIASLGVGSLLVPPPALPLTAGRANLTPVSDAPWLSSVIGTALIAGITGWLLPFPVFSAPAAAGTLFLLALWRRRAIVAQLSAARLALRDEAARSPRASVALVLVLMASTTSAWLPVMSSDDLATHLQIGWSLSELGYYRMDVGSQVWSLAPWLSDVTYGLQQLVAGGETAPVQNTLWLALTSFLIVRIGRTIGLGGALPWLAAMLYVSLPIASALTHSMQTETASAAATAALTLLVLRAPARPDRGTLLAAAALAGALLGMKIVNAAFVAPLALLLLWRWQFSAPWRNLPAALALGLLIAGSSYVYAFALSGNPVLPLFNDVFESVWFPLERQVDSRWLAGITPMTVFWLSFASPLYYEVTVSGTAGFVLILLFAGALGAIIDRQLRPLLLAGLIAWLIPFSQIQYLRYTVPALVILIPVLMAGLQTPRRWLALSATGVIALQLLYLPTGAWVLKSNAVPIQLKWGRDRMLAQMAPERALASILRDELRPTERLIFTSSGYFSFADLSGSAYFVDWYDPTMRSIFGSGASQEKWQALIERSGANLIALRRDLISADLQDYLVSRRAERVAVVDSAQLYRLPESQQPANIVEDRSERIEINFPALHQGAELISASVEIECSSPFKSLAVHWWLQGAKPEPHWHKFAWAACDANGSASLQIELAAPADQNGQLVLEAKPVSDEHDQRLKLLEHGQIRRPDLSRERDLGANVRRPLCRIFNWPCAPDAVKLLSFES